MDFTSFSINVLFLQHDPTRGTMLHLAVMSPDGPLRAVTVPQSLLVFHEPDRLKKFWLGILENVLSSGLG